MDDTSKVEALTDIGLFDGLETTQIEKLVASSHERTLGDGEVLTEPGRLDEYLWVFLQGRMRIETAHGVLLATVDEPRVLGEMGVLLGLDRGSRVVAAEETLLLELSRASLEEVVEAESEIGLQMLANLCRILYGRMHESNKTLEQLRERLAELSPDDPLLQD